MADHIILGPRQIRGQTQEKLDPLQARLVETVEEIRDSLKAGPSSPEISKLSKKDASYTEDGPFPFVCMACKHREPPEGCYLVEGEIDDYDTCRFWKAGMMLKGSPAEMVAEQAEEEEEIDDDRAS